jgi:hypothetical protein
MILRRPCASPLSDSREHEYPGGPVPGQTDVRLRDDDDGHAGQQRCLLDGA